MEHRYTYVRTDRQDGTEEYMTREAYKTRVRTAIILHSNRAVSEIAVNQQEQAASAALDMGATPVSHTLASTAAYYYVEAEKVN